MLEEKSKLNRRSAIKKRAMGTTALSFPEIQNNNYRKKLHNFFVATKQSVYGGVIQICLLIS